MSMMGTEFLQDYERFSGEYEKERAIKKKIQVFGLSNEEDPFTIKRPNMGAKPTASRIHDGQRILWLGRKGVG